MLPRASVCAICFEPCRPSNWFAKLVRALGSAGGDGDAWSLGGCQHVCCYKCIRRWVEDVAESHRLDLLVCPVDNCHEKIESAHVKCLGLSHAARMFVDQVDRWRHGTGLSCSKCRYINSVKSSLAKLKCALCKTELCSTCASVWHPLITCEAFHAAQQTQSELTDDDVLFVHLARVKWHYQSCPHCGVFTERRSGCAAMTCSLCLKRWNWGSG
ncbi:hypothetical protein H310_09926 [Aphanomyces invadans]|uniref:RING-type domain-containing protein n=1 Tax=Aphanomyces invadans TaxID=157072 RepID=A0A024TUU4_9STRA|nr:hypothetical protein H310_09926 [Aphanomyces invadans]ETV97117.1 hypothetical protein H310_09926 [Aphanomyces invadans]|eukprot:XP_008874363.1 hypothetical protein H310_09926 [Aphanomyces invadans]